MATKQKDGTVSATGRSVEEGDRVPVFSFLQLNKLRTMNMATKQKDGIVARRRQEILEFRFWLKQVIFMCIGRR